MADEKKVRKTRPASKERTAAVAAVKNAKSDQEKTLAVQALKLLRFKEVASIRVGNALKHLAAVEALCDTATYAWTDDQSLKIRTALGAVYDKITNGLTKPVKRKSESSKFTL